MADVALQAGDDHSVQHDQLPSVDEILIEKSRDGKPCRRIALVLGIVLCFAAVFAGGLIVGRQPWGNNNNKKNDEVATSSTSVTDDDLEDADKGEPSEVIGEYVTVDELVAKGIALRGGDEFAQATSYQSKALRVLKQHAVVTNFYYTDQKLAQRYALLCLYFRTYSVRTDVTDQQYGYGTTPPWKVLSPWKFAWADDECSWYGIACNMLGLVTRIELPGHLLTGYVPPELQHLANGPVTVIDLSDNPGLGQGGFPAVFTEFDTLDSLGLSGCNFSGEVPDALCKKEIDEITINCGCQCMCCLPCF